MSTKKTSQRGIALIKEHEGVRLKAYDDGYGTWTIGYGHTQNSDSGEQYPVYPGLTITLAEAEVILKADLASFENAVNTNVTYPINQNQFDALVSFTFNMGKTRFKNSDLLAYVNNGQMGLAASQFGLYINANGEVSPGLVRRRADEKALFLEEDPRLQ